MRIPQHIETVDLIELTLYLKSKSGIEAVAYIVLPLTFTPVACAGGGRFRTSESHPATRRGG